MKIGYTLMTEQSGPTDLVRYAVAAEQVTLGLLSGERFTLGLGSGENLNERVPIAMAVSGVRSCELFAPLADHMIAVEPNAVLGTMWNAVRPGKGTSRRIGQLPICFDADRKTAIARAHEQFRWFGGGWKVNAELSSTAGFAAASRFVRADDIAERISCGPEVDTHVAAARPFAEAGFTDLALVQIGGAPQHQQPFLDYARDKLLPAMRAEFTAGQP